MLPDIFVTMVLSLTLVICIYLSLRRRWLMFPILSAFFARIFLIILDYYKIFSPPGGNADALVFTRKAYEWSLLSWEELFNTFNYSASYVYSTVGAVFFKIFGFNTLLLPSLNTLAGVLVVYFTALMAHDLWGRRSGIMCGSIMALYPFAAFNSVIALREEFSVLLFVLSLFCLLKWIAGRGAQWILFNFIFLSMAIMLHPGWIGALIGVAAYLAIFSFRIIIKTAKGSLLQRRSLGKFVSSILVFLLASTIVIGSGGVTLAKGITIGKEDDSNIEETIESRFERDPKGGSAYPGFIATGNPYSQPWLIPARMIYFHFSPFPWDIRSIRHVLGLLSSLLHIFLFYGLYKSWGEIKRREECMALLLVFGALTFIFAIGVTNTGTAIRHKTKFLSLLVVLAGPYLNNLKIKLRRS